MIVVSRVKATLMPSKTFFHEDRLRWGIPLLLAAIALVIRLVRLDSVPDLVISYAANAGNRAIDILQHGLPNGFFRCHPGTVGESQSSFVYISLVLALFRLLGPGIFSLRLVDALLGTASVLVMYDLCNRLVGRRAAIYSALALSFSFFHVAFSRIGIYTMATFLHALVLLDAVVVLWKNERSRRVLPLCVGAVIPFAFDLYAIEYPLMVFALFVASVILLRRRNIVGLVLFLLPTLAYFYWMHRDACFSSRLFGIAAKGLPTDVNIFSRTPEMKTVTESVPIGMALENLLFNVRSFYADLVRVPYLYPLEIVGAIFGVLTFARKWNSIPVLTALAACLAIAAAPFLVFPLSSRLLLCLIPVYFSTGLFLDRLQTRLPRIGLCLVIILLGVDAFLNLRNLTCHGFRRVLRDDIFAEAGQRQVADRIVGMPLTERVLVLRWGKPYESSCIRFMLASKGFPLANVRFLDPYHDLEAELLKAGDAGFKGSAIFAEDETVRGLLEKRFRLSDVKRFTGRDMVFVHASIAAR
jgi:4-amino-4-deoxy-L-arabinose transferase-like glycosyltransferase